jgi:hypothetical protein
MNISVCHRTKTTMVAYLAFLLSGDIWLALASPSSIPPQSVVQEDLVNQLHSQTTSKEAISSLLCISSILEHEFLDYFIKLHHERDNTSGQCQNRSPKQVHSGFCSFNLFLVKFTISTSWTRSITFYDKLSE